MTMTPGRLPNDVLDFVHDTKFADLDDRVVRFAQRCVLDLIGVAAAGRTTDLSTLIADHVVGHFGAGTGPDVSLLFDGRPASAGGAALAGGMTIDAIDAHDGHKITKGHTGCHQFPALLAFAQAEDLITGHNSGPEMLAHLVVGYEFATRAGIALHATAPDYHTSGAWGAVGVAALGARMLKLDHKRSFEAMGIAEYHGPRSQMMRVIDHPTMLKDGSGWGAMAGVSAAYLAAAGFTGAPAVTVNDPALDHVWGDLGDRWVIFDQYFKPYPVCRWAQPAVEAALTLRRQYDIDPANIASIEVTTFHEAARLATAHPATTEHAQYSLPFPVAAALGRGQLTASEVTADGLEDPELHRLADLVAMSESDEHNAAFPANRYARVTVAMNDGETVTSKDHEPRGDPENHLSDDEIRHKFHGLAGPVLGDERARSIEAAVDAMSDGGSLKTLADLIMVGLDKR